MGTEETMWLVTSSLMMKGRQMFLNFPLGFPSQNLPAPLRILHTIIPQEERPQSRRHLEAPEQGPNP